MPRFRVRLAQKQCLRNFVTFFSLFFGLFSKFFLLQNVDDILSKVTSSDGRMGWHLTRMEEVKGGKKIGVDREKYIKKTGG